MKLVPTDLPDAVVIEPQLFGDARGFFMESYNARDFTETLRLDRSFVQDNHSRSTRGVLRGLHYQVGQPQGKLVRVTRGAVFDVAVDLRRASPAFGQWTGVELNEDNHRQFWIPPGFAHGFLVLSEMADFLYKTTDYYAPAAERTLLWNDPALGIRWPLTGTPVLSDKDRRGLPLAQAETYA